jgi:hypothetical protein
MKPEEIRDDIPEDVREALASIIAGLPCAPGSVLAQIQDAIRKRPATVIIPRAEIPAPLTEVPESGEVWVLIVDPYMQQPSKVSGDTAAQAVENRIAYATEADAQRALDAMMAREPVEAEAKADGLSGLIPWADLDPVWKWAAMDSDGFWYVYEKEPKAEGESWGSSGDSTVLPIPDGAPVPWTETKVRRPEGV